MEKKEVIEFANQHPVAWVATAENSQPHVRGLMMWYADNSGFYFHTGTGKRIFAQLKNNPKAELAFFDPGTDGTDGSMIRVTGRVEFVENEELEKKLFEERPWLHQIRENLPDTEVVIFRIVQGEAQFWNMMVNGREKEQPVITMS